MLVESQKSRQWQCAEVAQTQRECNPKDSVSEWSTRIPQRIEGGRIQASRGGGEESGRGTCQHSPDEENVGSLEVPRAIDCGHDYIPEEDKTHCRGYDEERDLPQALHKSFAKRIGDFAVGAQGTRHGRQLGCRHSHAEQADRKRVKSLRVSQ